MSSDPAMLDDGFSINFDEYFDMQYAGDSAAPSPLLIARRSSSVSCQRGFITEGYHITEVESLYGLSPVGFGDLAESDLTRWTRLNLVANIPWFRLIDLMCTLLNDHRGGKTADNGFGASAVRSSSLLQADHKPEYSWSWDVLHRPKVRKRGID
jgi:hypothetical protein